MNTARIVVLTIALGAGGIAAYLASGTPDPKSVTVAPVAQMPTIDVLVAKADIALGQSLKPDDLQWQTWPASTASNSFIRRGERPDATTQVAGSIARAPFIAGEPIREQKLVRADGSGFMAAILPTGMRAISTEISPETGAGGFILPNDRVDVILSKREKGNDKNGADVVNSEIILPNVRVLAIDQAPKEKDGQNTVVGKTVTLELKPEQAETLARARQTGTLALALRSIADLNVVENISDDTTPRKGASINVVRYGVQSSTTTQK
jgi:pilus assembly protein CpaB